MTDTPLLELRNITKAFGSVQALSDVNFEVRPGEVMALVGDNGAGKSTLVKCVAGTHAPDSGQILFEGKEVHIHGPKDAARLGISVEDDGPGFAPEIFEQIGEPYITSRGRHAQFDADKFAKHEGMGLGFFIAKVLLEQTGGTVKAVNLPDHGAKVSVVWPRGVIDGDSPPVRSDGT